MENCPGQKNKFMYHLQSEISLTLVLWLVILSVVILTKVF